MSNEILFNSPALHSLKRAQLVKLCRKHGIKAVGKNTELVTKLQEYGTAMPNAATFVIPSDAPDVDMEDADEEHNGETRPAATPCTQTIRPSEQWEVIGEEDDKFANAPNVETVASVNMANNEFGGLVTNAKTSSMGSSFKSIPSSLSRITSRRDVPANSKDNQASMAGPIEASPISPTDEEQPHSSLLVPLNDEPTSTIRLVSSPSQSKRVSVDYHPAPLLSSFFPTVGEGLTSPNRASAISLYPRLPDNDVNMEEEPEVPGGFPTTPTKATIPAASSPTPFFFGSPKNAVSNEAFTSAAKAVMDELNRRVVAAGGKPLEKPSKVDDDDATPKAFTALKSTRFAESHNKEFSKMDSIANHYAAKRSVSPSKPLASNFTSTAQKRKAIETSTSTNSVAGAAAAGGSTVEPREMKRARTSLYHQTRKINIVEPTKQAKEVVQVRDTPAAKRRLEQARARRSSAGRRMSSGRVASGASGATVASTSTKTGGKFAFLKSSARLVKSVFTSAMKSSVPPAVKTRGTAKEATATASPATTIPSSASIPVSISHPSQLRARVNSNQSGLSAYQSKSAAPPVNKSVTYKQLSAITTTKSPFGASAPTSRVMSTSTVHSQAQGANLTRRLSSFPSRKPVPTHEPTKPDSAKPVLPRMSSAPYTRSASNTSIIKETANPRTASNKGGQAAQMTAPSRPSTLYAPTVASMARMQSTVRPPQAIHEENDGISVVSSPNATFTPVFMGGTPQPRATMTKSHTTGALASPVKYSSPLKSITNVESHGMRTPRASARTPGRKPRISRGRVIAKLNEKRDASGGTPAGGPFKTRSSLAAKAHARRSLGGVKAAAGISRPSTTIDLQRAIKARQSEITRRKSKAGTSPSKAAAA